MSVRRYQLSVMSMLISTASFAILAVADHSAMFAVLAVAAAAWPIRAVIHYGSGRGSGIGSER